jgi:hypothetical protein
MQGAFGVSFSVGVHPPKTPVTTGSKGMAKATTPNVCKMPGPPAPFVPSPLPNIGKSGNSPKGYSKSVEIEGCKIAIGDATFESIGDVASKGTGGGLISANTQGPTKFIMPGSLTVKVEGESVHLLGEPMLNNCGPSGSPPNTGATMVGLGQDESEEPKTYEIKPNCDEARKEKGWGDCEVEQVCQMAKAYNASNDTKKNEGYSPRKRATPEQVPDDAARAAQHQLCRDYATSLRNFQESFASLVEKKQAADPEGYMDDPDIAKNFNTECQHEKWKEQGGKARPSRARPDGMNPDHQHPVGLGGNPFGPLKWANSDVNQTVGPSMAGHDPVAEPGGVKAEASCKCT